MNKLHSIHVIKLGYPGGVDVRCNPERQAISSVVDDFVAFNMYISLRNLECKATAYLN